jgi:multimeric flavodoxin WrbA
MKKADVLVMGSPMYWHSMSAAFRNLLDRSYGGVPEGALAGKDLYFVFQGAAPTKEQLAAADYTMGRYASLYGMKYRGMVSTDAEARAVAGKLA